MACDQGNSSRKRTLADIDEEIEELQRTRRRALLEETPSSSSVGCGSGSMGPIEEASITMPVEAMGQILTKFRNEDKTIPTFHGSVLDWPIFVKKYRDTTEEFKITDDANQKRLDKALKGEAREMVRELLNNACLVEDVMELLQDAYGGEDNVYEAVTNAVTDLKPLQADLKNIISFSIGVKKIQRMLRQCEIPRPAGKDILLKIVKMLPLTERRMWALFLKAIGREESGNIDEFVKWLGELKYQCKVTGIPEESKEGKRRTTEESRNSSRYQHYEKKRPTQPYYKDHFNSRAEENRREPDVTHYNRHGQRRKELTQEDNRSNPRVMTNIHTNNERCVIKGCNETHRFADCPKFNSLSQPGRFRLIQEHHRCPVCCERHIFKLCPTR